MPEAITVQLYWCLLEAGLALIAVCLPSVHGLFKTAYVKSLISNIRTSLGLKPLELNHGSANGATQQSTRSRHQNEEYIDIEAANSTGSHARNSAKSAYSEDTDEYVMENLASNKEYRY